VDRSATAGDAISSVVCACDSSGHLLCRRAICGLGYGPVVGRFIRYPGPYMVWSVHLCSAGWATKLFFLFLEYERELCIIVLIEES
jgi:hypothetical protein